MFDHLPEEDDPCSPCLNVLGNVRPMALSGSNLLLEADLNPGISTFSSNGAHSTPRETESGGIGVGVCDVGL